MRQIVKRPEPASLTTHRLTPHSDFDNYAEKDQLRAALVGEQRALCSYCMERIHADGTLMKIEHWRSQANYPEDQLDYQNLLGGCRGGNGQPLALQHCDARKRDADLKFNPANPAHHVETWISYDLDGTIKASDAEFNNQLNDVLNLNLPKIKNNRKGALAALLEWWKGEKNKLKGPVPRARIEREIAQRTNGVGDLSPYCQVAVWWLHQKLTRMQ